MPFTLDNLNFSANFDTGWYDPFRHELGISLEGMTIGQPYYSPVIDDAGDQCCQGDPEISEVDEDTGGQLYENEENQQGGNTLHTDESKKETNSKGCSTISSKTMSFAAVQLLLLCIVFRREK